MRVLLALGGVALALYAVGWWSQRAGPARTARLLRWCLVIAAAGVLLWITARGGGTLALLLASVALPLLRRWRGLWGTPGAGPGATSQGASRVRTRFLDMELDHASGRLSGTVREGPFQGRALDELERAELRDLWQLCQDDPQSAAVLASYLERQRDPHWRSWADGTGAAGASGTAAMSREEAYAVLGLSPGASEEAVRTAHRRLMQRLHPDHGGSDYLAARINEAKAVLLGS